MVKTLGVLMDPIAAVHYEKDSTLAMLLEAQARGYTLFYMEQDDLFLLNGKVYAKVEPLTVHEDAAHWFTLGPQKTIPVTELKLILMRKDPPFNKQYLYTTYLLEQAEREGTFVVNRPQALRDANEKVFAAYFTALTPPTIVTQSPKILQEFWQEYQDIVCKPLHTMGGVSVFRLQSQEVNANVIFEILTGNGRTFMMAQKFIPEIKDGDKRILLIDGEPIPHVLARIPQQGDWRGNLAVGAKGKVIPLSDRDKFICAALAPELKKRGLYFVGIDIIGDFLTEVNVTSPTGIREIDKGANVNVSATLFDCLERKLM